MYVRSEKTEPGLREWTVCERQSGQQTDSASCGVFVAMVGLHVAYTQHVSFYTLHL